MRWSEGLLQGIKRIYPNDKVYVAVRYADSLLPHACIYLIQFSLVDVDIMEKLIIMGKVKLLWFTLGVGVRALNGKGGGMVCQWVLCLNYEYHEIECYLFCT